MSVMSVTFGYRELCARSHEFLRRGCTYAPKEVEWAGDLVITREPMLKQSEVKDMRGEESDVQTEYEPPSEDCTTMRVGIPTQYKVEETDIRTEAAKTFQYKVPKHPNEEEEKNWDIDIYQSLDDCGVLMDGGDALQQEWLEKKVTSLCGTVSRSAGVSELQAHYLDNRKSYSKDPDNGLLVAIRTGFKWNWEVRYSPVEKNLSAGLMMSDDITEAFRTALAAEGMTDDDVFEFGMI